MAGLPHASRFRTALFKGAREAGEAFSRAFRAEDSVKAAPLTVPLTSSYRTSNEAVGEAEARPKSDPVLARPLEASIAPAAPITPMGAPATGLCLRSGSSKGKEGGPSLSEGAFIDSRLPYDGLDALGVSGGSHDGVGGGLASRLEESEGWFITDLLAGRDEDHDLRVRNGSYKSGPGSLVMVSSVDSLASMDGEESDDLPPSSSSARSVCEELETVHPPSPLPRILLHSENLSSETTQSGSALSGDIEEQIYRICQKRQSTLADEPDECHRDVPRFTGDRLYMIEAGHGWSTYPSLEALLCFLRETVKVFGSTHLRCTRFVLPVGEADTFLDELETIAPYSAQDFLRAAQAAEAGEATEIREADEIALSARSGHCLIKWR
ncbi:hypothetical protein cyc_00800 [Cyclospora cayetanensis]|uniref:Uncharacterized protein n=1 Tax=Cyclospora cayetanensis TaxID=88456 RepID=A0A1D3D889_9EIME|nr:hypothetical protein cyc_00800 [Cyclospora cayetanensis]